jgi:hypothetical protein
MYGKIKSQLKAKGTPIPENDIWIASLAEQHQLTCRTSQRKYQSMFKECCYPTALIIKFLLIFSTHAKTLRVRDPNTEAIVT